MSDSPLCMTDVVEWIPEGKAALANEYTHEPTSLRDVDRATLRAKLDASLARFVPCWERGLAAVNQEGAARADERGRTAVDHVRAWIGATPANVSVDEAASALSLLGSRSDSHDAALTELLLRDHGVAFMVPVLVAMWSLVTSYDDPDSSSGEDKLAIWLVAVTERSSLNDASVSYAKGNLALYLAARTRDSVDERAELRAAIDAAWDSAPLFARPALAVAADDGDLAERAMREILDADPPWQPHYARKQLPLLIRDRVLLERTGFIKAAWPRYRWLERAGIAALPIYQTMYTSKITKQQRELLTKQLTNIRGPTVATLLAPYAEKAPFAADIRAYFTRAPELLAVVRADKTLAPYAAQLDKLEKKIATGDKKKR